MGYSELPALGCFLALPCLVGQRSVSTFDMDTWLRGRGRTAGVIAAPALQIRIIRRASSVSIIDQTETKARFVTFVFCFHRNIFWKAVVPVFY